MRANKQSKIKVNKSGFKRSRFNWSHDVNTTFSWGEIQPTQCKLLIPGSKTTMSTQNLIRLAPMVAPTFGRVKYKTFNQFVGMSEIHPNFAAMMAQEPVTRAGNTFVPKSIPYVRLGQLSAYVLLGSKATLYWVNPTKSKTAIDADLATGRYTTSFRKPKSDGSAWVQDLLVTNIRNALASAGAVDNVNTGIPKANTGILPSVPNIGAKCNIHPSVMTSDWTNNGVYTGTTASDYAIALGMHSYSQLIPVDKSIVADPNSSNPLIASMNEFDTQVTMEGADYVIEFTVPFNSAPDGVVHCALAFEISEYGKRIRKIIQGCGYQIDFASAENVSILPLLAQFKAYFDVFGLTLFKGWETTACAKLIEEIRNGNWAFLDNNSNGSADRLFSMPSANASFNSAENFYFVDFMLGELANEFYTENTDYIGAHMPQLAVSPKADPFGFISVDSSGNIDVGANVDDPTTTGGIINGASDAQFAQSTNNGASLNYSSNSEVHAFIDQVQHGQVDAELLKRLYKWTNRNTILGRKIADLLRAQGFGKYVDECKSNYIGSTDDMITISDVTSLAATSDASLGEFGGKGIQYCESKTLVFENDEYGYWVTLATIVPEAGYTQGIDPTLKVLDKFNFYNPDFDALGMEITSKDMIVGNSYITRNDGGYNPNYRSFGFIPRYSKFKVCQNLVNGDFNRHNKRDVYLPYTLDKQINLNDYSESKYTYTQRSGEDPTDSNDWSTEAVWIKKSNTSDDLPVACNVYRMPTKYAWLGNFNRIFRDVNTTNDYQSTLPKAIHSDGDFKALVGFNEFDDDNFLSHGIYDVQCYAPMKPIEDSYGLEDDETDKAGVDFVTKA